MNSSDATVGGGAEPQGTVKSNYSDFFVSWDERIKRGHGAVAPPDRRTRRTRGNPRREKPEKAMIQNRKGAHTLLHRVPWDTLVEEPAMPLKAARFLVIVGAH